MIRINLPRPLMVFAYAITWGLISVTSYPSQALAQSSRLVNTTPRSFSRQLMPLLLAKEDDSDFSSDGRSGNRGGGGSRSNCPRLEPPLTALIPASNWGTTVAERPTFWFYVPYSPKQASVGEFVLQDEERNDIYRVPFTLPQTPGFVSFKIPDTKEPLEVDKWYRWYFNVYCGKEEEAGHSSILHPQSSSPVFAQGWVQRITLTPALELQLNTAKPREDKVYAANLIWFDALAHLANLRLTNSPQVTDEDWQKLLQAKGVNLELPNQEPMVSSVRY
ncbi:MAG: DUF928 domain-containing protein [Symploca sp. SIO1A3]|nr:DUF928 domain-containing protein [Symploca sp. SIO1A3]